MNPTQLLDLQGDLLSRLEGSDFRRVIGYSFTADHQEPANSTAAQKAEVLLRGKQFADRHESHVRGSYAYRVTADMVDMLDHMAKTLNEEDTWDHNLAPTGMGIVHFDKPIEFFDIRSRVMKAHWCVWGPVRLIEGPYMTSGSDKPTTLMVWYNDGTDPDEAALVDEQFSESRKEWIRRTIGRWQWIGAEYRTDGSHVGPPVSEMQDNLRESISAAGDVPNEDGVINLSRYVHALWLMLNQTFTDVSEEEPDRAGRKRAERRRLPARVTVIRLRRKESQHSDGESHVEWQHRWFVRGHWAWRNCGAYLDGAQPYEKGYRRRIYIPGYVKGPDDKPLIITEKVYSLER